MVGDQSPSVPDPEELADEVAQISAESQAEESAQYVQEIAQFGEPGADGDTAK